MGMDVLAYAGIDNPDTRPYNADNARPFAVEEEKR